MENVDVGKFLTGSVKSKKTDKTGYISGVVQNISFKPHSYTEIERIATTYFCYMVWRKRTYGVGY